MAIQASTWALAVVLGIVGIVGVHGAAQAQSTPGHTAPATQPTAAAPPQAPVYTRATVHSVFAEDAGRRQYIRLKLGPGAGLPFRTQTFRVRDTALLADHPPGASVAFVARRVEGENTVTALRTAPKIQRFDAH